MVFESLRTRELGLILELFGVETPDLPNTLLRAALKERFVRLRPEQVHEGMVRVLGRTRSVMGLAEFLAEVPASFRAAVLPVALRASDRDRLLCTMDLPMTTALSWA